MTHTLKDLLDEEQVATLVTIKASLTEPTVVGKMDRVTGKPASVFTPPEDLVSDRTVITDLKAEKEFAERVLPSGLTLEGFVDRIIDPLTLPEDVIPTHLACPPEPVLGVDIVEINGVQVDLRGDDPWFVTPCADCGTLRKVEVAPEGVDLTKERVVVCAECIKVRTKGKSVQVIHDPRVAKHAPRTKDGIDQPITVTSIIEKEQDVDLNQYSAAQLATFVERAQDIMRTKAEEALAPNVRAAIAERVEVAATDQARMEAGRESREGCILAAFEVKGVEVPALDLSEVTDMTTVVPAKQRSPYNKALFRTGGTILTADEATYEAVAKVHERLSAEGGKKAKKGKKAKATKVTAAVESEAKAKFSKEQVAVLAEIRGITKAEARKILASV